MRTTTTTTTTTTMSITSAPEVDAMLPSRLPPELNLSISRILGPPASSTGAEVSTSHAYHDDAPSLTSQLGSLFPSVQDLTPRAIERRQAEIRQELNAQERYIEGLLARLVERQDAIKATQDGEDTAMDGQVRSLLAQLTVIREKAHKSEEIVREITRDIRMLDTCKRNVVGSMTALKRLQMLVNAVAQLDRLTKASRFREAASSLLAVNSLLTSFKNFSSVERVAVVQRDVASLQKELGTKARAEIEQYFTQDSGRPVRTTSVPDAALVVDAIGAEARSSLIDFYTTHQLREYRRIFRATDEAGQLDNVSRRYAWFRNILKTYDEEHAAVFEEGVIRQWHVARELTRRFSDVTRQDIRSVLIRTQGKLQVPVLLEALSATTDFEKAMSKRFKLPFPTVVSPVIPEEADKPPSSANMSRGASVEAHKLTISSVFEPYLGLFVEAQERTLAEMLQTFKRQGTRASLDDTETQKSGNQHTVLPSSTELFYFYGSVLEQCGRLSTREPFRDLCMLYKRYLQAYAEEVLKPLIQHVEPPFRRSVDTRASVTDMQRLCMVINTSDYCATTSKQLEEKLREKIDGEFRQAVDFESERETYLAVVSAGVQGLARELEISVEAAFQHMGRVQWDGLNEEDTDVKLAYVDELASALEHVAVVVRQDVQGKRYVRNWCDKAVGLILARFTYAVVKARPVSRLAAKQLTTDLADVRLSLLELPRYSLSEEGSTTAASSYKRYVGKGVDKIETLLKLIEISDEGGEELIDRYIQLVGDRSFSNFQKVLDLKGVRKTEQDSLMDAFVSKASQNDRLSDSSFLTTLDLNAAPPGSGTAGSAMTANTGFAAASALPAAGGFLSFISGVGSDSPAGAGTPPLGATARYANSFGLATLGAASSSTSVSSSASGVNAAAAAAARAGKTSTTQSGDAVGAGAQRAFSDLRRFGSMLVGRRDASTEGTRTGPRG